LTCPALYKILVRPLAGRDPYRYRSQAEHIVSELKQGQAYKGRFVLCFRLGVTRALYLCVMGYNRRGYRDRLGLRAQGEELGKGVSGPQARVRLGGPKRSVKRFTPSDRKAGGESEAALDLYGRCRLSR
jgi:hypothetical protein